MHFCFIFVFPLYEQVQLAFYVVYWVGIPWTVCLSLISYLNLLIRTILIFGIYLGNNKTIWVHLNEFFMIGEEYNVVQTLVRFQVIKKKKEKEKEK